MTLGYAKLPWVSWAYLRLREISLGHLRSPWVVQNQLGITLGYAKLVWVNWLTLGCAKLAWVTLDHLGLCNISFEFPWVSFDYLGLREISLGHLRSPWVVRNQLGITLGCAKL